jgi:site-specific recombinase XerC
MNVIIPMTPLQRIADKTVRDHLRHLKLEGCSEHTIYHRERILIRLARALDVPLTEATADMLYDWRENLKTANGRDLADSTVICYVSHVKEYYKFLAERGVIAVDPAARIPVPKMPRRQPHPIGEDDLLQALDAASGLVRIWLVLAAWCGLRQCEIARLRTDCVRLRGSQPHLLVLSDATKGRTERTLPLPPFAIAELERAAALFSPQGFAFRDVLGRPVRAWFVGRKCNDHLRELGIPARLHSLRHRYGTQVTHISRDLQVAQKLLGHQSITTTAGYAAVDMSVFAPTVNAIPSPLPPPEREAS